jgi:hypothetical protein
MAIRCCGGFNAKARRRRDAKEKGKIRFSEESYSSFASLRLRAFALKILISCLRRQQRDGVFGHWIPDAAGMTEPVDGKERDHDILWMSWSRNRLSDKWIATVESQELGGIR